MAKLTYLEMVNRVLLRITQSAITDVTAASGKALIITQLINEAQNVLWTSDNWYSLYKTREFDTGNGTATYALASDWGRTIDLIDTNNDEVLTEDTSLGLDRADADENSDDKPKLYTLEGSDYRFYPIPDNTYTIRERYLFVPTVLAASGNTSDLPIEVENCIIEWVLSGIKLYLNDFEASKGHFDRFAFLLQLAQLANEKALSSKNTDRALRRDE